MKGKNHHNSRKNVLRELNDAFNYIHKNYKYFKSLNKDNIKVLSAAEWILDNIYLIEKEYKVIKKEMPLDYFKMLPCRKDFTPRIFEVAKKYISVCEKINGAELKKYIIELQKNKEDKPFTMGELWALPLMLKASLIINLGQYAKELGYAQEAAVNKNNEYKINSELLEKKIGNYITAIREIENVDWREFFAETSYVEKILNNDPINVYETMDFESKDYYRHRIEEVAKVINRSEISVAMNALELAEYAYTNKSPQYKCHVGYYLVDAGISELQGRYYTVNDVVTEAGYLGLNIGGSMLISALIVFISKKLGTPYTLVQMIISFLVMIIPINEIIISLTNWIVSKSVKVRVVPKMDFSMGLPYNCKTVIVVPSIANSKEKIKELMEKLEVEYCGNKDKNIFLALLNDFNDSNSEVEKGDNELTQYGLNLAAELNEKYSKEKNNNIFFFLNRKRIYNAKQKVYMGRERKRGKIMEFISLIRGKDIHTYDVISPGINNLCDVKYLITLDEDTFMPRETVHKLVGAMNHVLNTPYIEKDRVFRGYGIMQPKVSISLEAKDKSYFSKIFAGENSVDGYSVAYSDIYEDIFNEGSFVGKGIINIDEFYNRLNNSIKDNKILSHDLLEGALCRCALLSDVEFIDDYPNCYEASCKRLHRWTRGDWQLIGWLFSKKISLLNKWKIFNNLRRSLLAPNLLLALLLSLTILNNGNQLIILSFLALITPLVFTVTDFVVTPKNRLMGSFKTFQQILIILTFIPYESFLMIDAIILSLFRVCISKRNLLEWKSSQYVARNCNNNFKTYIRQMWIAPVMGLLVLYFSFNDPLGIVVYAIVVAALWISSPYIAFLISRPLPRKENNLNYDEKTYLREISRRIFAYYQDFINKENNYLAPDNYQEKPYKGVAHRTSPTNIGMGIISQVTAYDMGYITMGEFIDKSSLILENMKSLKKIHGHFLNWYDTRTKEPLWPRYISTVDSGNLLANLWILKVAMEELKSNPIIRTKEIMALKDIYRIIESENPKIKIFFAENISLGQYDNVLGEIITKLEKNLKENTHNFKYEDKDYNMKNKDAVDYWIKKLIGEAKNKKQYYEDMFQGLSKVYSREFLEGVPTLTELLEKCSDYKNEYGDDFNCTFNKKIRLIQRYIVKINKIIEDINTITEEMNFKFLYDESRSLFSIGYNVEENSLGSSYYDLLASESRIASFVAIAKNDIPKKHWFKLSRAMTNAFHTHTLVSWSGTMFEYFMPSLIMKAYPNTLLKQSYKDVIKAQMSFARQKKIPWGISECAFYNFDNEENYQYKAFGVPGLGLKRGLEDEIVVAPYSTLMALPFAKNKCIKNLKKLEKNGLLGRYGFIEAVDYTKARQDKYIFKRFGYTYTQNVDKYEKSVDNYKNIVDKAVGKNDESLTVDNVDNVHKESKLTRNTENISYKEAVENVNNPQNDIKKQKSFEGESYPQGNDINNIEYEEISSNNVEVYNDGIRPNKIITYMVHHLGMSLMALENTLMNNILINRFHSLPEVKATELLLKERIPHFVTFERNEDYSIKNRYFEGKEIIPRVFENARYKDPQVMLLSNMDYSTMINTSGSGYSKKSDMMLYRWKGNATSDDSGMFIYIKNLNSNDYWSSTFEPCKTSGDEYNVEFSLDKAEFNRKDGNIKTKMEVVLALEDNFEVRKITLENLGDKGRSIELTSYMEVVLAGFSADAVHPAFSNLFVQTEFCEREKAIIGSRRGRVKNAKVPYIFHKAVVKGEFEGAITYETSRLNFVGRNRTLKEPVAMDNDKALENTVGTVLDPIISMRATVRVNAHEKREVYFITGTTEDKEEALDICKYYKESSRIENLFEKYHTSMQLELRTLELNCKEANVFQDLASSVFYLNSTREDRAEYIKNIHMHQKDLWAYGISGDLPIVLLTIEDEDDVKLVLDTLKFHYYMKIKGVKIDLVIYNNEELSYEAPLQKTIMSAINTSNESNNLNKPAGVFLYNKSTMSDEVKDLLIGICRIYFNSNKGAIFDQIKNKEEEVLDDDERNLEHRQNEEIRLIQKSKEINAFTKGYEVKSDLDFYNGYGGFSSEDNSYVIKLSDYKNTPAPWINVMSNENFGFHISEAGSSYTWCQNSRENKLTPWSNDYIRDPMGEALYIKDDISKKYFSITPKPVRDGGTYTIKHGFGYSEFTHEAYDIKGNLIIFAPKDENVKLQKVTLENLSNEKKEISIYYYAKLVLGVYEYDSARYISTFIERNNEELKNKIVDNKIPNDDSKFENQDNKVIDINIKNKKEINSINSEKMHNIRSNISYIHAHNPYSEYFGKLHAYLTISGGENLSFSGDNKEFLGAGGEMSAPNALFKESLSNRCGSIYDPALCACTKITLDKGEKKELTIIFGQDEKSNIEKIINKYSNCENTQIELDKVKEYWNTFLGNIQVKTPSKSMNYMLNGWLLYQTLSCRYLSRSAFYQSGGAYGFRDQLQDSMALGVVDPEITKSQILKSAARQYTEGDVQHWWHPVINSGIRTRFSDDLLWLPYVTAEYINSTGDYEILNDTAPYLKDEPLREGEDERYTIVNETAKEGSIYEHCLKAIEKSLKFGKHNIPLMGSGDWNDGMSTVGNKGKGESVWLGWFLYSILDRFITIAAYKNDLKTQNKYEETKEFIRENLEKNAWDGGWYRRAYFDDGTPLGSRENPECQIDSLAQTWSIISGAASNNFKKEVMLDEKELQKSSFSSTSYTSGIQNNDVSERTGSINASNRFTTTGGDFTQRAIEAINAVESNLVKKDKGMILLLEPPFDNSYLEPGYIKGYVPGVRENGGQYTHAAVWVILALTKLKYGNKAVKYYDMINPINHARSELECMTYKVEPYVMAADVYIKEPHGGRGGWSWYTGASGWMYKVGIENILGLKKDSNKGYIIDPCVPNDWEEYEINIKNDKENYKIKVMRKDNYIENIKSKYLKKNNENTNLKYSNNEKDSNIIEEDISKKDSLNNNEKSEKIVVMNNKYIKDGIIPRDMGKATIEVYI